MKTKTGMLFIIYAAAAVLIASVVRFFQYETIIEPNTGFFVDGCEAMGVLIYIILAVFGALLIALTIVGKKKGWTPLTVSSDGMSSKSTIIAGAAYLVAALVAVVAVLNMESGFKLFSTVGLALSFGIIGFCLIKNSVPPMFTGFVNLYPALYFFMLSTELFTSDLVVKNRSDSLILLLVYVTATLFFASGARFYARLETRFSRSREMILGGFAFVLSFVHVFSKLFALIFGENAAGAMSPIGLNEVIVLVVSAGFIAMVCTTAQTKEIDYIVEEKKEEAEK